MATVFDVVSGVYARAGSSNITGFTITELTNLGYDAITHIGGVLGTTIGSDSIGSSYLVPIKDLTTAYVMARMMNVNIDTDVRVGNLSISYASDLQAHQKLIDFFMNRAKDSINDAFGMRIAHTYTNKVR